MGFSEDNLKGFILALMSSLFIGASFIIKKKGLRRAAAASGVRAGIGGFSYLLEPLWWLGMITMIIGEVANFVAYAFAPAVLVTPLGALSIIVSAVLAQFILNEKLHQLGILGCVMCIAGSVVIVIHAPQEHPITSVQEICSMATQPGYLFALRGLSDCVGFHSDLPFCSTMRALECVSVHRHLFIDGFTLDLSREVTDKNVIYAFLGQHKVMSVKALGTALKLTFEGNNQLLYPETWFFVFIVATCVITQMNYLNKALDTFNTAVVSPIYYVMFTSLTILASVIMFKDWDGQSVGNIISEICGFIVVLSGTILLHTTKDFERSSSFRGSYASLSPALSARLCSGNGEFMKHDEENQLPAEALCFQRQEMH
ncbi:hypothetical protein NC653_022807 [Populus alba x Populus x berolinensis]|uniref:Probable magnesium transporter n=1 Tax=Populus alba x Populus x berolinensis TaxID=444605 RepID=A0AAD6MFY0_9ROSI|nr:hypothetical protein NC653_022807 [Populus alba x Populus x berolinensis]